MPRIVPPYIVTCCTGHAFSQVEDVQLEGKSVAFKGEAMVDSGTTMLLLPEPLWSTFTNAVRSKCPSNAEMLSALTSGNCFHRDHALKECFPVITIEAAGGLKLSVRARAAQCHSVSIGIDGVADDTRSLANTHAQLFETSAGAGATRGLSVRADRPRRDVPLPRGELQLGRRADHAWRCFHAVVLH